MSDASPFVFEGGHLPGCIRNVIADPDGVTYTDGAFYQTIVRYGSHESLPVLPAWAAALGGEWYYTAPTWNAVIDDGGFYDGTYTGNDLTYLGGSGVVATDPEIIPLLSLTQLCKLMWRLKSMKVSVPEQTVYRNVAGVFTPATVAAFDAAELTVGHGPGSPSAPASRTCVDELSYSPALIGDSDPVFTRRLTRGGAPIQGYEIQFYRVYSLEGVVLGYFLSYTVPHLTLSVLGGYNFGTDNAADHPTGYNTELYFPSCPFKWADAITPVALEGSRRGLKSRAFSLGSGIELTLIMNQKIPAEDGTGGSFTGIEVTPALEAVFYTVA